MDLRLMTTIGVTLLMGIVALVASGAVVVAWEESRRKPVHGSRLKRRLVRYSRFALLLVIAALFVLGLFAFFPAMSLML